MQIISMPKSRVMVFFMFLFEEEDAATLQFHTIKRLIEKEKHLQNSFSQKLYKCSGLLMLFTIVYALAIALSKCT
jgi:hypothetical protein